MHLDFSSMGSNSDYTGKTLKLENSVILFFFFAEFTTPIMTDHLYPLRRNIMIKKLVVAALLGFTTVLAIGKFRLKKHQTA